MEKFKNVEFTLPPNYLPENDRHADAWARLNEQERKELTEWMRVYYAMTANLDDNIGRLVKAVRELGLEENTIFIFTSDHGELFGAHGRRAKNIFYEEAVRVPFLIRWKGTVSSNEKCFVPFNTVDIMPTLLSMMDMPIPEEVEGRDISSYILGKDDEEKLDEYYGSLMMGTGATAIFEDGHEWRAYRTKQYTYAIFKSDGMELLFDNINDPYQMKNLIDKDEYKDIANELKSRMYREMEKINDTFEFCSYYRDHWIKDRIIIRTATLNQG